ncbi:MAG: hypothetical protein ACREDT_02600 [Methylocella sp.]
MSYLFSIVSISSALRLCSAWTSSKPNSRGLKALPAPAPDWAEQVAVSLSEAARRIEHVAQDLNDSSRD